LIFKAPQLDPIELEVVKKIDSLKGHLRFALSTPQRWDGLLRRVTLAKSVQGSNTIEGYNITVDDAIALAEGEEPLDADDETRAAVSGYQRAMTYVLRLAVDPYFKYSGDLLRSLHYMMLEHDLSKSPGQWRTGEIFVQDDAKKEIVYYGPDADDVPSLIDEFISDLETDHSETPDIVCAAMAHLNLVMIHPFRDGNGRMARALQTLVLGRSGTLAPTFSSIEEYLGRNTHEYYAVLAEVGGGHWAPSRDARPWIRFCLRAHYRQATTLLRRIERVRRIWDAAEEEVSRRRLPERLIYAVVDATLGHGTKRHLSIGRRGIRQSCKPRFEGPSGCRPSSSDWRTAR
jgi:Fic family protein